MKGLFITIEGGDGAGKSTQIRNMESFFEKKGLVVVHTREPGGTAISEKLRDILLDSGNLEMQDVTEMLIYAASRAQHVRELVIPALEDGKIVICDRFLDSSIAYQAYGRGLGKMVETVNSFATDGLVPDITFWMDIDPKAGRERVSKMGALDRLEMEQLDFHYKVYEGYKTLAEESPGRIKRIDAGKTVDEISKDIDAYLTELCSRKGL